MCDFSYFSFKVSSVPDTGLKLTTLRARVARSTNWASQVPYDFSYFERNLEILFFFSHTNGKKLSVHFHSKGIREKLHSYIVDGTRNWYFFIEELRNSYKNVQGTYTLNFRNFSTSGKLSFRYIYLCKQSLIYKIFITYIIICISMKLEIT